MIVHDHEFQANLETIRRLKSDQRTVQTRIDALEARQHRIAALLNPVKAMQHDPIATALRNAYMLSQNSTTNPKHAEFWSSN